MCGWQKHSILSETDSIDHSAGNIINNGANFTTPKHTHVIHRGVPVLPHSKLWRCGRQICSHEAAGISFHHIQAEAGVTFSLQKRQVVHHSTLDTAIGVIQVWCIRDHVACVVGAASTLVGLAGAILVVMCNGPVSLQGKCQKANRKQQRLTISGFLNTVYFPVQLSTDGAVR